jgi:hypothetical protein
VAGHQDGLAGRIDLADGAQHVESVEIGHPQVDDDRVRLDPAQVGERGARVGARHHVEPAAAGEPLEDEENTGIVVDGEQRRSGGHRGAARTRSTCACGRSGAGACTQTLFTTVPCSSIRSCLAEAGAPAAIARCGGGCGRDRRAATIVAPPRQGRCSQRNSVAASRRWVMEGRDLVRLIAAHRRRAGSVPCGRHRVAGGARSGASILAHVLALDARYAQCRSATFSPRPTA